MLPGKAVVAVAVAVAASISVTPMSVTLPLGLRALNLEDYRDMKETGRAPRLAAHAACYAVNHV